MEQNMPPQDSITSVNNQNLKPEKPKRKFHLPKITILIGFFIVLLILMEGGLFLAKRSSNSSPTPSPTPIIQASPTPDPTATWQTFEGDNFSFRYPNKGYEAVITNETKYSTENNINIKTGLRQSMKVNAPILTEATDVNTLTPSGAISAHKTNFSVWVFQNTENLDINEWYQKYWYYPFNWGEATTEEIQKNAPTNKILINGNTGGYITQDSMGKVQRILIPNGNQMFVFEVLGESGTETVGNQILSTFQFANSAAYNPPSTSGGSGSSSSPANPGQSEPAAPVMVACTMEAKLCPDGVTSVGRSGPKCEFEKCPGE